MMKVSGLQLFLLVILLSSCGTYGVYLGCFPFSKLNLQQLTTKSDTAAACETSCEAAKLPFAASIKGQCWCTSLIPDYKDQLQDEECTNTTDTVSTSNGLEGDALDTKMPVMLNYVHNVDNQECALAPLPFDSDLWSTTTWRGTNDTNFNDEELGFELNEKTQELSLNVNYALGSVKASSKDKWAFGMYSLVVQPFGPGLGAVTAFYTSSDDNRGASSGTNKWDEIDIEFINRMDDKNPDVGPNSVWLNIWSAGKNFSTVAFNDKEVKTVSKEPTFVSSERMATYSFNWQPDYVNWYIEDQPVLSTTAADAPDGVFPSAPSNLIISIWIPIGICQYFGGCNGTHGPYTAKMADIRRVVCGSQKALSQLAYPRPQLKTSPPPTSPPRAFSPPPMTTPKAPATPINTTSPPPPNAWVAGIEDDTTTNTTASNQQGTDDSKKWAPAGLQGLKSQASAPLNAGGVTALAAVLAGVAWMMA